MKPRHSAQFRSHASITAAFSVALLSHFAAPSASALTYYWDNDGATAGFGTAAGTWAGPTTGNATQGWSQNSGGTVEPVDVTTTTSDTVNFGTGTALAAGTVNVGTVNVGTVNFGSASGAINLSGGTISLDVSRIITAQNNGSIIGSNLSFGGNGTISFSRNTSAAGALTINGQINGSGTMTFTTPNVGSGGNTQTIVLGAANTWTGNTTITTANTGNTTIIRAGVNDALPTTTVLTLNGGNGSGSGRTVTFDLNGKNQTLAGLSTNISTLTARNQRVTSATAATLTISNSSDCTFGGSGISSTFNGNPVNPTAQITGSVSLAKSATGTFTILGSHSYTGTTTISGGKLQGIVGGNCASSKVVIDNALATFAVSVTDNTRKWTCKELAPTAAGTIEFNFGAITPSTSISPLTITVPTLLTGLADFTVATPKVKVNVDTGLAAGTYPLMTWDAVSGTVPSTSDLTVSTLLAQTVPSLQVSGNTLNLVITSTAVSVVKADNATNLSNGLSWVGGSAPGTNSLATWNNTVTSANITTLGADLTWAGITIENPNGPVTINGANTLTLGAAAVDINLGTTPVTPADLTVNCPLALGDANNWDVAASRTLSLGGPVSGAFGVTKLGAGTAILSSAANSYTGNTTVSAGALKLGASNVIPNGAATGNVSVAGTLDLNGQSETVNGLSGAGTIDNLAATTTSTLTVGSNDQTGTFSGVIQNTAGILNLTKTGTGALTLSGPNNFTGTTSVTGGALILGHASALGGTSGITLAAGTSLTPGISAININKPITLGTTGTTATITAPNVAGSGTTNFPVTVSGGISGDGNVNFSGVSATNGYGVINLNAASNYAGSTLITTISAYGGGPPNNAMIFVNLGVANALPVTTVLTLDGGDGGGGGRYCELDLNGKNQTLAGLTNVTGRVSRVQRVVNNSATAATLTINNAADYTYSGQLGWVSGYGSTAYNNLGLAKSGTGIFTVSGSRTYTGSTTVTGGTLSLGTANPNNDSSSVTIGASGILQLTFAGSDTVDKLFINGIQQPAGTYGHSSTGATNGGGGSLDTRFAAGTGTLMVTSGPGYASWQSANGPTTQTLDLDHDNDGVSNGIEYFLGGNTNTTGFTALPAVVNTGGTLSVTWTKAATYTGTYGTDFWVETSATLTGVWTPAALGAGLDKVDITTVPGDVKYTFPAGTKNFARLKVTGP